MKSKVHVALSAVLLLVGLVSNVGAAAAPAYANKQFPSASMTFTSTGFFHTAYEGGRWWLVTPDGHPFYSSGIDHVSSNPDTDQKTGQCPYCNTIATTYSSTSAWESAQVTRLRTWGFNTIGPFSDFSTFSAQMPYTDLLSMASGKDWFAPAFSANAQKIAQAQCAPLRNDPNLIGYFLDSEVHWGADWREQQPVLNDYLALPPGSPGLAVAQQYVGDPSGFLYALATRFFQVTTSAIRSVDPNHLILGVKAVAQLIQPQLLEAAAPYVDVWSVDDYQLVPQVTQFINSAWPYYLEGPNLLGKIENLIGKPLMIGEYSFRSSDSGLTNSWPPIYPTYASQGQRAAQYQQYVSQLYQDRYVVGDNWFEFVDEPYNGRFDGEDSNFGILSTSDIPYTTLVNRMKTMHALAPDQLAEPGARCLSWSAANSTPISNGSDVICTYSSQSGQANTNPATGGGYWTVDSIGLVSSF